MLRTVYAKLATVLLVLFFLLSTLYVLLTLFTMRMYLQEVNQKLNRTLAQNLVSQTTLLHKGQVNEAALKEIFHMLMVINPSIEVYLLDTKGSILTFSLPLENVKRQAVSLEPLKRFLSGTEPFPILGDDPGDPEGQKAFSVSPIPMTGELEGYLYVVLGGGKYESILQMVQGSYIIRLSFWTTVAGLIFSFFAGLLLFYLLTRRVRLLASTMDAFAENNFSEQGNSWKRFEVQKSGSGFGDEIDRLGNTFNKMSERIVEQVSALTKSDELRRELVANVSHDIHTPLTSLQGHLESLLLREGKATSQERRDSLEVALKHSERLAKLTSELFELSKLESQDRRLHVEVFSLGELLQDVTQKFYLAANNKQVRLQTNFRTDLSFVSADIGLIERVFENLLENAVRYTPEDGTITVTLTQEEERIKVQVSDTGCGIPQERIPYVFERFYRVEPSFSEESRGAGLGLSIVKQILDLHGSPIEVLSTVNEGSTFSFYLPISTSPKNS